MFGVLLVLGLTVSAAPTEVFVTPAAAARLVENGAVVIDARDDPSSPYLSGAQPLSWMSLRDGLGRTGRLADIVTLERALEAIGVDDRRAVLVYGDADKGWGEEARIWWMLRYLGHERTRILDGGIHAWRAEGHPTVTTKPPAAKPGLFTPKIDAPLRADYTRVNRMRKQPMAQVLDTRTTEEFLGATPYWSFRGGHVPGAKLTTWKDFLGPDGRVLPRALLAKRIARLGLVSDRPTVTYCTGGVRSAFVTAALIEAGFDDVANYDGSWWDWSSRTELPVVSPKSK